MDRTNTLKPKEQMRYTVSFEIDVKADASYDDVLAWVRFEVGDNGSINSNNPCLDEFFEPVFGTLELE